MIAVRAADIAALRWPAKFAIFPALPFADACATAALPHRHRRATGILRACSRLSRWADFLVGRRRRRDYFYFSPRELGQANGYGTMAIIVVSRSASASPPLSATIRAEVPRIEPAEALDVAAVACALMLQRARSIAACR